MTFLEKIANKIATKQSEFENLNIICPNIRTIDYLKHYLAKELKETVWSPKFMNLSELTSSFTDFQKADELVLLIELYKSFKIVFAESKFFADYDFDKFYGIGEIIQRDFNEIDNYLVDVEQIFVNISDYESINYIEDILTDEQVKTINEFFKHFSTESISEEKKYFKELWSKIPELYKNYTEKLLNKKIGYNGLISKELSEKIKENKIEFDKSKEYIFIGFNALTKAQKVFLKAIQKTGKALFYWDYDNFYTKDLGNEAGLFVRQNLEEFPNDLKIDRDLLLKNKNIKLIGFPLEIAQTKALPTILKELGIDLKDKEQLAKTAVVMPDDNLLFPVLHALPPEIKQVNVTLGFPFRNTSIFTFISDWLNTLHKLIKNENIFYDDILTFIDNQIVREILNNHLKFVTNKFKNSKQIYFNINDLGRINNYITNILFDKNNINSVDSLLENILKILEIIFHTIGKTDRKVETEAIFQFYKQMLAVQSQFLNELAKDKDIITVKILLKFLKQMLSGVHIPFQGKSLDGMQLMTIMETRNLDFENLIILNMNEQIIPKKASHSSLISEFMRKSFEMPILMYQDSIFAFLFYSLIQNSKNIVLTYSNLISDKSGELSRFVQQLIHETNIVSEHKQYSEQIRPKRSKTIKVEKNNDIIEKLNIYLYSKKLLSASALNIYISCPLKFYFQRIAKIEPPTVEENEFEIDALKFGNIFHNTMEELYKPYIGKELIIQDYKKIEARIDDTIKKMTLKALNQVEEATITGLNNIVSNVIKKYVNNFIEYDKKHVPFRILNLEWNKTYKGNFEISVDGKNHNISLIAVLDRVDEKDKLIRIIDYKTGSDELTVKHIDELFDTEKAKNSKKAIFQMLLYSIIFKQENPTSQFEPIILKTTELNDDFTGKIKIGKELINSFSTEILSNFEIHLKELLEEIFDKDFPFYQTENFNSCVYCDFQGICGR